MSLFERNLELVGLGVEGDTPGPGTSTSLPDGIHLRWLFERERAFPWHGYYLLRREADSGWRKALVIKPTELEELIASFQGENRDEVYINLGRAGEQLADDDAVVSDAGLVTIVVGREGAAARHYFEKVGTARARNGSFSIQSLLDASNRDSFALQTTLDESGQIDLYGLSLDETARLRLQAPPPRRYRRARLRLGFLADDRVHVSARQGDETVEEASVAGTRGDVLTVVLESDRRPFSVLDFDRAHAVLLNLDVVFVLGDASWHLADGLREPQPLRLPLRHPDYPAGRGPEDPAGARSIAASRSWVLGTSFPNRVPGRDLPVQGTVDVTNGSPFVQGRGTAWDGQVEGQVLQTEQDEAPHLVMRVLSPERLVLARPYAGPSRTQAVFSLNPDPFGQLHDVLALLVEGGPSAKPMAERHLRPSFDPGGTVRVRSGRTGVSGSGTSWSRAVEGMELHVVRDNGTARVTPGTNVVEGVGTDWTDSRFHPLGGIFFSGLEGSLLEIDGHSRPYVVTDVVDGRRLRIHPPIPRPGQGEDASTRTAGFRILERRSYRVDRVESTTVLHLDRPYVGVTRDTDYVLRVPSETGTDVHMTDQRLLDLALLGSLSPVIAQALGLHVVDAPPRTDAEGDLVAYDYLLVADHEGFFEDRSVATWVNGVAGRAWLLGVAPDGPDLDAAITYDHRIEPASPPAVPEAPKAYRLGDTSRLLPRTGQPHEEPIRALAGLTWDGPSEAPLDEFPMLYHVWRQFLGEGEAPVVSQPEDPADYLRLTEMEPGPGQPGPVVFARSPSAHGLPQPPSDWPRDLRYRDMVQDYGWYSYRISAVDLFGRHSERSDPAPWWRSGNLTHGRPPEELHAFAVRISDDAAPPRPTDVEAEVLDPADPHVQRDAASSAWRDGLPEDRRDELVGLRVRWRWTQGHMQQAPDTTRFQICYHPHRLNVLQGRVTQVDPDGPDRVLVTTDLSLPESPRYLDGAHLRVGRRAFRIEWTQQARQDPLRVRVAALGPDGLRPAAGDAFVIAVPRDAGDLHTDYTDPDAWDDPDVHRVPVDDFVSEELKPRLDGSGRPLTGDGADLQGLFLTLPAGVDLDTVRTGLDHVHLPDDAGAAYYRIADVRAPEQPGGGARLWLDGTPQVSVSSIRWTIGEYERRYEALLPQLDAVGSFDLGLLPTAAEPVAFGHAGVTAHDDGGRASRVSAPAKVYRVRRTAPPAPPPPGDVTDTADVFATPADYHGRSYRTVSWPAKAGHGVHVFRALDDGVFARDAAIRSTRGGLDPGRPDHEPYFPSGMGGGERQGVADALNGIASPGDYAGLDLAALGVLRRLPGNETVVASDEDALRARREELTARDWELRRSHGRLAAGDPVVPGAWSHADRRAVADDLNALDPSDRDAYDDLSNRALRVLASLPGHAAVFTQLSTRPVPAPEHTYRDTLPGRSRNRFFYRVAYVDAGGNQSELSLSGPAIHLPDVTPPPAPQVASHECTDGELTLAWTSSRAADLATYHIYRTDEVDRARDTRLMEHVHIESVDGAVPPSEQPSHFAWTDDDVQGGLTYYYRFTAEDVDGNVSRASPAYPVTAVDRRPPEPPVWIEASWVILRGPDEREEPWPPGGSLPADARPAVKLVWKGSAPGESFLISRKRIGQRTWTPVAATDGHERTASSYRAYDREAARERSHVYRIGTIAPTGVAPDEFRAIAVSTPD